MKIYYIIIHLYELFTVQYTAVFRYHARVMYINSNNHRHK